MTHVSTLRLLESDRSVDSLNEPTLGYVFHVAGKKGSI